MTSASLLTMILALLPLLRAAGRSWRDQPAHNKWKKVLKRSEGREHVGFGHRELAKTALAAVFPTAILTPLLLVLRQTG